MRTPTAMTPATAATATSPDSGIAAPRFFAPGVGPAASTPPVFSQSEAASVSREFWSLPYESSVLPVGGAVPDQKVNPGGSLADVPNLTKST